MLTDHDLDQGSGSWSIDLTSPQACQAEIQDCSRGLAYLDHHFGRIVDELITAELDYAEVEAQAIKGARRSSSDTAAEIKARITEAIEAEPEWTEKRDALSKAKARRTKIDRWIDSLQRRQSAAQSCLKGHDTILRGGGA